MANPYRAPGDPPPPTRDTMKPVLIGVMVLVALVAVFIAVVGVVDARKGNAPASSEIHRQLDWPGAPKGMCPSGQYAKRGMAGGWICCNDGAMCD